jgi:hypothetical protein
LLLAACAPRDDEPLRLQATVVFPPRDTIRFALPATSHYCADGKSLVLEAVSPQGNGVLARLHYDDSLIAGSYAIAAPGDSGTVPSAQVAVRYLVREVTHGFAVDSGSVEVRRNGEKAVTTHIEGTGIENAIRTPAWIDFRDVPLRTPNDTVPCVYVP